MRGGAAANGAISLVNAIASGRGATVGVDLRTEARVELSEGRGRWEFSVNGEDSRSRLVFETLRIAAKACGMDLKKCHGYAETKSTIPMGVGLKSSSSAAVAVAMAVFDAAGRRNIGEGAILKCSVQGSLASRTSITGALDDAASCLRGGFNLANNFLLKVVSSSGLPKKMDVVIRIPRQKSRRGSLDLAKAKTVAPVADALIGLCQQGDYWTTMTLNGLIFSELLGYRPDAALKAIDLGACGAGLSGTGPSVAAVFDSRRDDAIRTLTRSWSQDGADVIRTSTTNRRASFHG